MKILPSPGLYNSLLERNLWSGANDVLYDMCRKNPEHKDPEEIFMKFLIIGRSYAASVERRKTKEDGENTEKFYRDKLIPAIQKSHLDEAIQDLRNIEKNSPELPQMALRLHGELLRILNSLTKDNKRSFCSKYLHFHLPEVFYIYDSRSREGIKKFLTKIPEHGIQLLKHAQVDNQYAQFYIRCQEINNYLLQTDTYAPLTPRQMDTMLLLVADKETEECEDEQLGKCVGLKGELNKASARA